MPKVLYFADPSNGRPGLGATIRLDNGEPCLISVAQAGVRVKKSRLGIMGAVLYDEKNVYKAAARAKALSELFPNNLLPLGFTDPVLSAFSNAVLHCSSCAEVAMTLNEAPRRGLQLESPQIIRSPQRTEGGATPESAIRIHASNSIEGIPKEYEILRAMFGTLNKDWKLINRSVVHAEDGRKLEKFILSASNKRREVYFDITDWLTDDAAQAAKLALDKLVAPHDKSLAVLLPKEEFMTLQMGLLRLTEAQLKQIGLSPADRKNMLDPFLDAMKLWIGKEYANIPEHVNVTTPISVWLKILGLIASWEPANLRQEEELANLQAIISGTIKDARNVSPSGRQ